MANSINVVIVMWFSMSIADKLEGPKQQVFESLDAPLKDLLPKNPVYTKSELGDTENKINTWSWDFGNSGDNPWTAFIFTLSKEKKINRFCGATIMNENTLFTSCACMRSYFSKHGHHFRNDFISRLKGKRVRLPNLDLGVSEDGKYYVWHSLYKPAWHEDMFKNVKGAWPWRVTTGKRYKYLKQNYRCWVALLEGDCEQQPRGAASKTCNVTDKHNPWESENCEISTVVVLGITPKIEFMPHLPWPPKPELYSETEASLKPIANRLFWTMAAHRATHMHHSLYVSSFFLRLVNGTNHIFDEFQEKIYIPHSIITISMTLCDQQYCAQKEMGLYKAEILKFQETNVTCMCTGDPLSLQPLISDWKNKQEVLRLCGGDIGFPVFSTHGFHGITVTTMDCEKKLRRPAVIASLPFHPSLVEYIESILTKIPEQQPFVFQRYDTVLPEFRIGKDPNERDPDIEFYIDPGRRREAHKSRGHLPYKKVTLKQFANIIVYTFLTIFVNNL